MPRQARLDVPGALHHIMVRGIDKCSIFRDGQDKTRFLERLGQTVSEGKCTVYAWVLMDNHVHILFKSGKDGISAVMRKLLTWGTFRVKSCGLTFTIPSDILRTCLALSA